jgi:hypothetical protein
MNRRPPTTQAIAVFAEHCLASPSDADLRQGLTLVHFSVQRKPILWDTLGA